MTAHDATRAQTSDIAAYYDDGYENCLRDYIQGNRRIQMATEFFLSRLKRLRPKRLLDVGCGIGNAAHEFSKECPWLEIVGVDISEKRIETANRLFHHERLQFRVSAMESAPADGVFDAVTMMDVYEHIPRERADAFHVLLARLLSPSGIVLMTTPSALHQAHLTATRPDALQIVDEIIGAREIVSLADGVSGIVTHLSYETVWRTNDYVHSVIERAPRYERRPQEDHFGRRLQAKVRRTWQGVFDARTREQRAAHVERVLGLRVGSAPPS